MAADKIPPPHTHTHNFNTKSTKVSTYARGEKKKVRTSWFLDDYWPSTWRCIRAAEMQKDRVHTWNIDQTQTVRGDENYTRSNFA